MCQAVLSPNLTKKFQWEVSQIADNRFPLMMLLGGLSVNLNHLKRVPEITEAALLQVSDTEREQIQAARIASTRTHQEKGNKFTVYILGTGAINEVWSTLKHLSLKHPHATQITVAYNIAREHRELSGYADRGEYGAGARLLKVIRDSNTVNVAIYLIRYHSGINLGVRRFEIFK